MIRNIPTAADFRKSALDLLFLSWRLTYSTLEAFGSARSWWEKGELSYSEQLIAGYVFWTDSQSGLGNALALLQQSMELALKGRIAEASPYLLIADDPRGYPKGSATADIEFSEFRTIEAFDLIQVHNTHCSERLGTEFTVFWDETRRQRNAFIHSVTTGLSFRPPEVFRSILTANKLLFGDIRWPKRLLENTSASYEIIHPFLNIAHSVVSREVNEVVDLLAPAEVKNFFQLNVKTHRYVCPRCYYDCKNCYRDDFPLMAQLKPRSPKSTTIWCCICERESKVNRRDCQDAGCPSNVICADEQIGDVCLVCTKGQTPWEGAVAP